MSAVIDLTIDMWDLFQAKEKQRQQESRERLRREYEDKAKDERGVEGKTTEILTEQTEYRKGDYHE